MKQLFFYIALLLTGGGHSFAQTGGEFPEGGCNSTVLPGNIFRIDLPTWVDQYNLAGSIGNTSTRYSFEYLFYDDEPNKHFSFGNEISPYCTPETFTVRNANIKFTCDQATIRHLILDNATLIIQTKDINIVNRVHLKNNSKLIIIINDATNPEKTIHITTIGALVQVYDNSMIKIYSAHKTTLTRNNTNPCNDYLHTYIVAGRKPYASHNYSIPDDDAALNPSVRDNSKFMVVAERLEISNASIVRRNTGGAYFLANVAILAENSMHVYYGNVDFSSGFVQSEVDPDPTGSPCVITEDELRQLGSPMISLRAPQVSFSSQHETPVTVKTFLPDDAPGPFGDIIDMILPVSSFWAYCILSMTEGNQSNVRFIGNFCPVGTANWDYNLPNAFVAVSDLKPIAAACAYNSLVNDTREQVPVVTKMPVADTGVMPLRTAQFSPNPFQSTTSIRLPDKTRSVDIFDAGGNRVWGEKLSTYPGQVYTWRGNHFNGRPVKAGVYLVRFILTGGEVISRKVVYQP